MDNKNTKKIDVLFIVQGGLIAAVYIALNGLFQPIAFGPVQVRISEAFVATALYTIAAVPGLTIGCLITNLLWSPFGLLDVLLGTIATFIGVFFTYFMRNGNKTLALIPPVISNALLVPVVLMSGGDTAYWLGFIYILIGQSIACIGLGTFLSKGLEHIPWLFKKG